MSLDTGSAYGSRLNRGLRHPGQIIASAFFAAITVGTGLLSLPMATASGKPATFVQAVFTATSAVCVTGHAVVDTGTFWSPFGQVVIILLVQLGGLGIMTMATLFMLAIFKRWGLSARSVALAETRQLGVRDVRRLVRNILLFSLASELVVAVILTARFTFAYDRPFGEAVYHGVFHAISAFNNGGFALYPNSLMDYVSDPWISLTVITAFTVGGLGYPVVFELARRWRRPRDWSVVTRITVWTSLALLLTGTAVMIAVEHANPSTLGPLGPGSRLLAGFFAAATTRSGGFNTIDTGQMTQEGWLASDILMFIGGGSAGTAGGIKVTTFGLLAFVIWSELRGEKQAHVRRRRIPESNQRQALAIALLGVGAVAFSTFALMATTEEPFDQLLFEVVSAFATCGLSTGLSAQLPEHAQLYLTALMYIGRIGPLTIFSALALRERGRRFVLPEERTIVG